MVNPQDPKHVDALGFATGMRIVPSILPELRLFDLLEKRYGIPKPVRPVRPGQPKPAVGQGAPVAQRPAPLSPQDACLGPAGSDGASAAREPWGPGGFGSRALAASSRGCSGGRRPASRGRSAPGSRSCHQRWRESPGAASGVRRGPASGHAAHADGGSSASIPRRCRGEARFRSGGGCARRSGCRARWCRGPEASCARGWPSRAWGSWECSRGRGASSACRARCAGGGCARSASRRGSFLRAGRARWSTGRGRVSAASRTESTRGSGARGTARRRASTSGPRGDAWDAWHAGRSRRTRRSRSSAAAREGACRTGSRDAFHVGSARGREARGNRSGRGQLPAARADPASGHDAAECSGDGSTGSTGRGWTRACSRPEHGTGSAPGRTSSGTRDVARSSGRPGSSRCARDGASSRGRSASRDASAPGASGCRGSSRTGGSAASRGSALRVGSERSGASRGFSGYVSGGGSLGHCSGDGCVGSARAGSQAGGSGCGRSAARSPSRVPARACRASGAGRSCSRCAAGRPLCSTGHDAWKRAARSGVGAGPERASRSARARCSGARVQARGGFSGRRA